MPDTAAARHLAVVPDADDHTPENGHRIEQHVLGTAMDNPIDLTAIRIRVQAASFTDPRHRLIWEAICEAADSGEPTNATAITERLIRAGQLGRLAHGAYMFDLVQQALPGQAGHWAMTLARRADWRDAAADTARLVNMVNTPGATLDRVAELAEAVVATAHKSTASGEDAVHLADLAADYITTYFDYGQTSAVATPWPDLNRLLTVGGFTRGQLVTFGGASGMGKSIAITDCARHLGVELQVPTLMFTLEMTAEDVLYRVLAGLTGIPEKLIKTRELSPAQLAKIDDARLRFEASPLWIVEGGGRTVTQIANIMRQHRHRHGAVHALVVDYLQLIGTEGRRENRQLEVSSIVQKLKQLALNEDVLVITASQINRAPAARTDKRPTLADLRESGEIENSSDTVVLIYREDYYDKESPRAGEADFILAKQRGGALDTVTLAAQFHLTRFSSMAEDTAGAWDAR